MSAADTTARKNLLLLTQLRWIAVVGQLVTIWLVDFELGIRLPLVAMLAVVLFLVMLNLVSLLRYRRQESVTNTELFVELLLDIAALTVQLYLSGGALNPFISLFLLQVILGAILLEAWSVWSLVAVTSLCFVGLTVFHRDLAMQHSHMGGFWNLHVQGMFICFVLASCLLVLFITRITANLNARDAYLAELRRQSVEEEHIVRMGLLASGAAHELGTPLSTLSVLLNDWQHNRQLAQNPELAEDMREMQAQLDRCKAIVTGILLSSGEARGEGTVRTSVRALLDEVALDWQLLRAPVDFSYVNAFEPDAAIVSDLALKQVLFNVLDNAVEASPDRVELRATRRADALRIEVTDHGTGFRPDILAEFGKPYRSTKARAGAGLGLFLVVNVLRRLGGTVEARNIAGGGACVTLDLPLAALSEPAA
ncbi:sensor histidine kinase [Ancylobacter sp. TS-1]|nr:sensor histidine kinase [Ancylobacter sp. TS-1]